eukprot:TRINITY_DN325_c0_g1_i10.p2 TRINITY_DN325_c0_g1~~TRINITY_DN325_c0_g1_i10.p2  ORF type:complete len:174 (+),score=10.43 TRINITY_DN325_c0_g1_i10:1580-2101(+)
MLVATPWWGCGTPTQATFRQFRSIGIHCCFCDLSQNRRLAVKDNVRPPVYTAQPTGRKRRRGQNDGSTCCGRCGQCSGSSTRPPKREPLAPPEALRQAGEPGGKLVAVAVAKKDTTSARARGPRLPPRLKTRAQVPLKTLKTWAQGSLKTLKTCLARTRLPGVKFIDESSRYS